MNKKVDENLSIDASYQGHAGGWGALKSTATHWLNSKNAVKNIKTLLNTNQSDGFDCPGCAWGEEKKPGRIRFCENGAKAVNWEATTREVGAEFFARHSVHWLNQQTDYFLEYQGRLTQPMRYHRESDHYRPVSWDDAFQLIADHLRNLDHPDQLELYTSGRASNEAAYLYQLFGRAFGTNNFPDCSNMCHEASGFAMKGSIGVGKGTVTLHDFEQADAILVFGQNPGTNHPRMLETLRSAMKRGAHVIILNNLKERGLEKFQNPQSPLEMLTNRGSQMHSIYLMPRLGGDMAVIRGVVKQIIEWQDEMADDASLFDEAFLDQHTQGITDYLAQVRATDWKHITEQSGLNRDEIRLVADIYCKSDRVISTWAMGITQHHHSVPTIHELINLMLLRGNIGKLGAGLCPVRGHSNVQGDRTMGIDERPSADFLNRLADYYDFEPPEKHGHAAIEAIEAMQKGESTVFIGLGGNFAAATPDSAVTARALQNCKLTVQISTKLNRSHLVTGEDALILPCLGRTDIDHQATGPQKITVEDSFSMVHASAGVLEPLSADMRSEPAIIAGMAQAVLGDFPVPWLSLIDDYSAIRELIEGTIPGFSQFNAQLEQPGGFYLGNTARDRQWNTLSGKAVIHQHALPESILPPEACRQKDTSLILQTLRSHDQYNTTVYGMNDRYRGIKGERKVLFINPEDIEQQGLTAGQEVTIRTIWDDGEQREVSGFRLVPYRIPVGNLAAYYPETNPLVPLQSYGTDSRTPTSKSIAVELLSWQSERII